MTAESNTKNANTVLQSIFSLQFSLLLGLSATHDISTAETFGSLRRFISEIPLVQVPAAQLGSSVSTELAAMRNLLEADGCSSAEIGASCTFFLAASMIST